jgi:truncated hemoglobin YjbI
MPNPKRRAGDELKPDPELWAALGEGEGLTEVLRDFYTRVFEDERLSVFFPHVTKDWVIEKQYSFLAAIISGEKLYFGYRPRNAHAHMVISDELFDYRESMMEDCLRRYGLAEHLIRRVRAIHEVYRKQIVKAEPWPRIIRGHKLPIDGYESLELAVGTVCDGCEGVMETGDVATYHLRTGEAYCARCVPENAIA